MMLTPQQAFRLFAYADWIMLLAGMATIAAAMGSFLFAILPMNKGRRGPLLRRALICLLLFAMYWGTQASVLVAFWSHEWTPLRVVLFALPIVLMLAGLVVSIAFGARAVLRQAGQERRQMVFRSLLGMVIFSIGIAPHTTALLIPILSAQDHANVPGTLTQVGESVPDFELTSTDGIPFRTGDLRGRVIVLNFFATWCGPCQQELPHLQAIWDEYLNNDDFSMLVVGREESDDAVSTFQQQHGFTFPMAADPDKSIYDKFATESIPRTYLISRQGIIIYQSTGYYQDEIAGLKKRIRKELAKPR